MFYKDLAVRRSLLSLLFVLGACSVQPAANRTADVNAAAEQAQADIDTYAANAMKPAPVPMAATSRPAATPSPGVDRSPVSEASFAPDSAQGAADVVQRYFASIEAKKYDAAYRLWGEGGKASRMSARQFADSFARYASYHAEVGAPGDVDAGAGQRYVQVPVTVYGVLADGKLPFRRAGNVTLHRTGDIDGATAEERSWHIREIGLKPPPDKTAAVDAAASDCGDMIVRVSARDDAGPAAAPGRDGVWRREGSTGRGDATGCTRTY